MQKCGSRYTTGGTNDLLRYETAAICYLLSIGSYLRLPAEETLMAKVLRSNLVAYLLITMTEQGEIERLQGFKQESSFLAGLKEVLKALKRGESLEIVED